MNHSTLPLQISYNLVHQQQRYSWDCGLTCIMMILSMSQKNEFLTNFTRIRDEEGFGSSTWTIDLSYLLGRFKVRHEYLTKTLGVDPNYKDDGYYKKIITKDEQRVNLRFQEAREHGLTVMKRTVTMDYILKHLAQHGPVILLTNASLLTCSKCKPRVSNKTGYTGHYVVVRGYDLQKQKIYYSNPEVKDGHVCESSMKQLDFARKAYGTDEDILLIFK